MDSSSDFEMVDSIDESQADALVSAGEALIDAILERRPFSETKELVAAGAPLWYQNDEGVSALHAAAYVENADLVKLLIEEGAIWNAGKHF